jgi:hypothetical protein
MCQRKIHRANPKMVFLHHYLLFLHGPLDLIMPSTLCCYCRRGFGGLSLGHGSDFVGSGT